ncbi:MAG: HAD family hydrolase [Acutalibacteraceae bacterium]
MSDIKAAIFDLDGTLIDSMYVWEKVDHDFLTQRGIPVTQEYIDNVRCMFFETAAKYTIETYHLSESVEQIVQIWLNMARHEYEFNVKLKQGVYQYLEFLKSKNIKIGIATSSNPYLTEPVLEHNGISGFFDTICYTSQVGKSKEFPDIYLYTAKKLGAKPSECVVFEDIVEGISSAKTAGMKTVAVYDNTSENQADILKKVADKYIFDFSEMLEV